MVGHCHHRSSSVSLPFLCDPLPRLHPLHERCGHQAAISGVSLFSLLIYCEWRFRHRVLNGPIGLHPFFVRAQYRRSVISSLSIEFISQICLLAPNDKSYKYLSYFHFHYHSHLIILSLLFEVVCYCQDRSSSVSMLFLCDPFLNATLFHYYYYLYLHYHDSIRFTKASIWLQLLLHGAHCLD